MLSMVETMAGPSTAMVVVVPVSSAIASGVSRRTVLIVIGLELPTPSTGKASVCLLKEPGLVPLVASGAR